MTRTVEETAVKPIAIKNPTTIGLDLAKSIMHLHALDEQGKVLWKKTCFVVGGKRMQALSIRRSLQNFHLKSKRVTFS